MGFSCADLRGRERRGVELKLTLPLMPFMRNGRPSTTRPC